MTRKHVGFALVSGVLLGASLFAGRGTALESARAWEYRHVTFHGDYAALETALAAAGADGYELVLISPQETVAILKRPARS